MSAVDLFLHHPVQVSTYHKDGRDLERGEEVTDMFQAAFKHCFCLLWEIIFFALL